MSSNNCIISPNAYTNIEDIIPPIKQTIPIPGSESPKKKIPPIILITAEIIANIFIILATELMFLLSSSYEVFDVLYSLSPS